MPRWKKPDKTEIKRMRAELSERAKRGDVRIPEALVDIRKSLGMTQTEFARITGLTVRQVAEIETGKGNPTLQTLLRFGDLFGFTLSFVPKERIVPTVEVGTPTPDRFP